MILEFSYFLKQDFIYFQREGKWGRKKETSTDHTLPPRGLAHNPGTCPDRVSKP